MDRSKEGWLIDMKKKRRKPTILSWEDAELIRKKVSEGLRQSDVAKEMGLCRATVCFVVNKKQWAHKPYGSP